MKKIIILGELLFVMCFNIACGNKVDTPITDITINGTKTNDNTLEDKDSPDDAYLERMAVVNDKISLTIKSKSYQSGNIETRSQLINEVLETLMKDQYLKDYTVYTEGENPHAEFTYQGGGTGCVMFCDFKKDQN